MGNHYSIDRIVSAANMFDILPESAAPGRAELTEEVKKAKAQCKKIFRNLPDSVERSQLFDALARLGQSSLRRKIEHRAKVIEAACGDRFLGLRELVGEAVTCRNHFVHGSFGSFDYVANFETVTFFCETLQFVFGCSDLVDAGWDMKGWLDSNPQPGHPFGGYFHAYCTGRDAVVKLKAEAKGVTGT